MANLRERKKKKMAKSDEGVGKETTQTEESLEAGTQEMEEVAKPRKKRKKKEAKGDEGDKELNQTEESPEIDAQEKDKIEKSQKKKKRKDTKGDEEVDKEMEQQTELSSQEREVVAKPRKKKKRKEVKNDEEVDKEINQAEESTEAETQKTEKVEKTRKKKKKAKSDEDANEELIQTEESTKVETQRTETMEKPRKKKKKAKSDEEGDKEIPQTEGSLETEESGKTTKSGKKRKKKEAKAGEEHDNEAMEESPEVVETEVATPEQEIPPPEIEDDGRVLGITVHKTDKLVSDLAVSHPLVRVTLVDLETGACLKKQNLDRPVTSFFESSKRNVDVILPILTQPYDFRAKRSVIPEWNEMVLFNENYNYVSSHSSTVAFFELLDFVSMNQASEKYTRAKEDGGWHRIAWAFLKLRGANGAVNTDKRVRLQLIYCPSRFKPQPGCPDVYTWWRYYPRDLYPSTLYVTVKGVVPPESLQPAARSMIATQPELGSTTYKELRKSLRSVKDRALVKKTSPSMWGRLPGQMCKIPNKLAMTLPAGRMGCYVVKFSNDGRLLACGCQDRQDYTVMLYEIPSGELKVTLSGHHGLIYDMSWSADDKLLVTGSGDGTGRVWDTESLIDSTQKLLPHPAFLYSCQFHSKVSRIVATGCYDGIIRVWDITVPGHNALLVQEIDYHQGHVNSLCFDEEGARLYSADSQGVIAVWMVHVTVNPNKPAFLRDWSFYQEIRDEELKGTPISDVRVFYGDRRLLVQSRDNTIRVLDLRVYSVMQRYMGSLNFREHIHCAVTPCGSFVMSGSEDHVAYVWNTETGHQVAVYDDLNYGSAVTDVDFHPHEHMVAFCSYGDNQPVLIYKFDSTVARKVTAVDAAVKEPTTKKLDDPLTSTLFDQGQNFSTYDSARYSKVMQKLGAVVSATSAFRETLEAKAQKDSGGAFDRSQFLNTSGRAWRPGFTSVGRVDRESDHEMSMNFDRNAGTTRFSFKSKDEERRDRPVCLVLYDYKAARSDELDLRAGDMIAILHKDNDNWWMAEIDGKQGYVPSNYVEEQRPEDQLEALSSSSGQED